MPLQILREAPAVAPLPPIRGFEVTGPYPGTLRAERAARGGLRFFVNRANEWVTLELSDVEQLRDALNDLLEQERGRSIYVPKDKHHPDYTLPAPETESVEDFIARGRSSNAERLRAAFEGPLPRLLADPELYIERKERR